MVVDDPTNVFILLGLESFITCSISWLLDFGLIAEISGVKMLLNVSLFEQVKNLLKMVWNTLKDCSGYICFIFGRYGDNF